MQITINIPDEIAAKIQSRGVSPQRFVEEVLAEHCRLGSPLPPPRALSPQEFEEALDRLARFSDQIPALPIEAFSRESLYSDHD